MLSIEISGQSVLSLASGILPRQDMIRAKKRHKTFTTCSWHPDRQSNLSRHKNLGLFSVSSPRAGTLHGSLALQYQQNHLPFVCVYENIVKAIPFWRSLLCIYIRRRMGTCNPGLISFGFFFSLLLFYIDMP